jgi:predicted RNA binding protein YcfA (HicA-like mRNA interferase family)
MKLPRGVPADRLIGALERLGYGVIRQKGSHVGCGTRDLPPTPLQSLYTTR